MIRQRTKAYKMKRDRVAESLAKPLVRAGIHCPDLGPVLDALARFKVTNCDYYDCYLAAQAVASGVEIASFDRDFSKFKDVALWETVTQVALT
jgi:predicted nucleic acid-binding protein